MTSSRLPGPATIAPVRVAAPPSSLLLLGIGERLVISAVLAALALAGAAWALA